MLRAISARHCSTGLKPGCFSPRPRPMPRARRRQLHVHRDAQRLVHVPGRVDEELDAVAFGVVEVHRQRVAVRDRDRGRFTFSSTRRRYISRRPANSAMRNEIWLMVLNSRSPGLPVASTIWWCSVGSRLRNTNCSAAWSFEIAAVGNGKTEHPCVKILASARGRRRKSPCG